jgi:DNA-directed RNA polymerase subunit alpha
MIWHEFQRPPQVQPDDEERSDSFGRFLAQPFERGWGTTVGNALRRALLSSIPGGAITAVKIEGANTSSRRSRAWSRTSRTSSST